MDWTDDTEDDWADFEAAPTFEQSTSAIELNNTSENAALAINRPAESFDEAHESQFLDHKDVTTDYQQREAVEGNVCEFVASNNNKEEEEEIRHDNEKEIETDTNKGREIQRAEEAKVFELEEKPKEIETETVKEEEVKVSEPKDMTKEIETEMVRVEEVKVSKEEEKPKEIEAEAETVTVEEVKVSEPEEKPKEIEAEAETVTVEEVKVFEEEEKPKEIEAETETALIKVFEEEENPTKIEAEAETVKVEEVKVSEEVLFESAPTFSASDVNYLTISESIPSSTNALNNNDDQFPYEFTSNSATFDFSPNIGDQDNEHAIKEESVGLAEEEREQKSSNIQEDDWDDFVDPSVPVPAEEPMKEQESRENAIDAVGESGNNDNDEEWEDFIDPSSPVNQESLNVSSFPEIAIVSYDTENKANETQEETFGAEDEDEDWDAFEAAPVTTLTQQTTNEGDRKNEDLFSNNAIVDKPEDSFGDEDDWNAFEGPAATSAPTNVITQPVVTQPPAFTAQFEEKKEESFGFEADFGDFNSFEGGKDTQASSFFEESEPKRSQRDAFSDANETREFDLSGIEGVDAFKTLLGDSSLKREVVSAYLPLANLSYKIFDSSPIAVSAQDTTGVKECLENASSDALHPWGDSLSSFQAERKGQYYYLHNDLGAGTPTSSHRWFCKEVKKILLENIPSDALPTDQMKSTIQKSFSITQDFVQPAQPTQTTQPAPSLNLPKISKVNNAPAVERVTESSAAPTVVLEDPKGKRPPAQSSVGSKSIEQNKPEITPTSRSSEAVKAEVKKEGEIGATLRIGLNQDELSPAAFNYLKNLPDFSFLLQVND